MFIVVMLLYIYFNLKVRAFNYDRIWMWHVISLSGVLWLAIMSQLDLMTSEHLAYVVLMFLGWAFLLGFGIFWQRKRYPSMLYGKKRKDSSIVFQFGFRKSTAGMASKVSMQSQLNFLNPDSAKKQPEPLEIDESLNSEHDQTMMKHPER